MFDGGIHMHERVMRENYAKAYKLVVILAVVLVADGGVAVSQRRQRGNEQVPVDDSGLGGQSSGGGRVPYRARRAPAEEGGGVTMGFLTPFHGLCMALADSVPGVSGGTVAFILGFYDRFINALHDLFVHYPSDVLAGAVLGVAVGLVVYRVGMRYKNSVE